MVRISTDGETGFRHFFGECLMSTSCQRTFAQMRQRIGDNIAFLDAVGFLYFDLEGGYYDVVFSAEEMYFKGVPPGLVAFEKAVYCESGALLVTQGFPNPTPRAALEPLMATAPSKIPLRMGLYAKQFSPRSDDAKNMISASFLTYGEQSTITPIKDGGYTMIGIDMIVPQGKIAIVATMQDSKSTTGHRKPYFLANVDEISKGEAFVPRWERCAWAGDSDICDIEGFLGIDGEPLYLFLDGFKEKNLVAVINGKTQVVTSGVKCIFHAATGGERNDNHLLTCVSHEGLVHIYSQNGGVRKGLSHEHGINVMIKAIECMRRPIGIISRDGYHIYEEGGAGSHFFHI